MKRILIVISILLFLNKVCVSQIGAFATSRLQLESRIHNLDQLISKEKNEKKRDTLITQKNALQIIINNIDSAENSSINNSAPSYIDEESHPSLSSIQNAPSDIKDVLQKRYPNASKIVFEKGYYFVYVKDSCGVCKSSGEEIIPTLYCRIVSNGNQFVVLNNNLDYAVINDNGKVIIPFEKYEFISSVGNFYIVGKDGFDGVCDRNGQEIMIPNRYDSIKFGDLYFYVIFNESLYEYGVDIDSINAENKGVCTLKGTEIVPCIFYDVYYSKEHNDFIVRKSKNDTEITYSQYFEKNKNIVNSYFSSSRKLETNKSSSTATVNESIVFQYIKTGNSIDAYDYLVDIVKNNGSNSDLLFQCALLMEYVIDGINGEGARAAINMDFSQSMRLQSYLSKAGKSQFQWLGVAINDGNETAKKFLTSKLQNLKTSMPFNNNNSKTSNESYLKKTTCSYCNGKGWIPGSKTVTYGSSSQYYCNECEQRVNASHSHDTCPSCMGRGYIEKSK